MLKFIIYKYNIIQNLNSVPCGWRYYVEYSHIKFECGSILHNKSVPRTIVLDLNNVMKNVVGLL